MKILILAGGSGQRLYPLTDPPKQFRCFGSSHSLLQLTLKRFLKCYPPEDLYILTSQEHQQLARSQAAAIHPDLSLLIEPEARNTAPAIAFALDTLGDAVGDHFLIAPSDHYIQPEDALLNAIEKAYASHLSGAHTLFGITPTHPHPGYGYIQHSSHQVTQFIEKPDADLAASLIEKGCLWNSGIALFDTETLRHQLPSSPPSTSIDRLVLERADNLRVLPLDLEWSDLGTWEGIYAAFSKDERGNVIFGPANVSNVKNCLVYAESLEFHLSGHHHEVIHVNKAGKKTVMSFRTFTPLHL